MTQPVQEPTQGRTDQAQDWRTRQLFRRPSPSGGSGGGPATWVTADEATIPNETFTDVEFAAYEYNGLEVTSSDMITFDLPDRGTSPLYLINLWLRVSADSPADPYIWRVRVPNTNIPEYENYYVPPVLPLDAAFGIGFTGLFFGTSSSDQISVSVWQNSGVDGSTGGPQLGIAYLGQYQ